MENVAHPSGLALARTGFDRPPAIAPAETIEISLHRRQASMEDIAHTLRRPSAADAPIVEIAASETAEVSRPLR